MGLWLKKSDGTVVEINSDGIADAPEDGKQYARKDAAWSEVAATDIDDAPEDGKQYARQDAAWSEVEAAEVLRGDPNNPPADWATDQLLYDGVEDDGSTGGGGPHDHAEYAAVEHDHDEFTHDHDYLPLSGGTLTGELTVDGHIKTIGGGTKDAPVFQIGLDKALGMSGSIDSQIIRFVADGEYSLQVGTTKTTVYQDLQVDGALYAKNGRAANPGISFTYDPSSGFGYNSAGYVYCSVAGVANVVFNADSTNVRNDLQVDGNADLVINAPADAWGRTTRGTVFTDKGMTSGTQGSFNVAMTCNGYRNDAGTWSSLGLNSSTGATTIELMPNGTFYVRAASNHPTGSAHTPPVHFTVTEAGPAFRAQPSKTRSTDEVLERAETAEFPPEDDEGVATMDGHDEVPLFEVVTALLAKVKEMSDRIEELEGA